MKTFYLFLLISITTTAVASEPDFNCTVSINEKSPESIELLRAGRTFTYWEGTPLRSDIQGNALPSTHFIGIDYYPGMETIVLRIREKDSDRMLMNRIEKARDGEYNLTLDSENGGIFGQPSVKSFRIDCTLKNAYIIQ